MAPHAGAARLSGGVAGALSARVRIARRDGPAHVARSTRELLPGLLLAGAIGLTAHLAASQAFPYALAVGFEVPLAMLLGLIVINLWRAPEWAMPGVHFAVHSVLKLGIILLGLRLNLQTIAVIGADAIGLVVATMCAAVAFAVIVGRRIGIRRRVAVLIGVGTAVCGNSAIVAASPVVKADDREASSAVATITVFGTLAVFVFPLVAHALELDVLTAGMWAGTAVPDTAQTIAASAGHSTVGRDVATVVKLVRNVLMVPLLLLLAWAWSRYGETGVSAQEARRGALKAFPFFLLGFLALALVRTARLIDPETVADIDVATRACFVVALAGLGMQTQLGHLRVLGPRPFVLGFGTASLVAGGSLAAILAFGLGPARTNVEGASDPRPQGAWTTVCKEGRAEAFPGAFVALSRQLGATMGAPRGCLELHKATGEPVQRTTRGVATFSRRTGRVTFFDGTGSWSLDGSRLLSWSGSAANPPPHAHTSPLEAPTGAYDAPLPRPRPVRLRARLVATGIPGAGALSPVGKFHPGGPIHDKRAFARATRGGKVLDRDRLLVASTSNFGAPVARADWSPGAILSIATDSRTPLRVPSGLAAAGGQSAALGGAARLYTAQSPAFLNRDTDHGSGTARMPAVANPLGISINNAFGRPWFANSPTPAGAGIGAETVLDPDGRPLADPPSERAGGVFAGALTNRAPQRKRGDLRAGAVGNALLGASPDASGRAVFAVATADGALSQVHVEDGVDGLAPAGTLAPVTTRAGSGTPGRTGMVFNWVPDRFLYVADPGNNAILQLHLDDDFRVFEVIETRRLESTYFSAPVDLAPAVPEIANPAFSSNTTAAGGADLYVANRDSGRIVRMAQDGRIVAVARVILPGVGVVGAGQLNGIAVAPDADKIWVSLSGRGAHHRLSGSVLEIPAFGASR